MRAVRRRRSGAGRGRKSPRRPACRCTSRSTSCSRRTAPTAWSLATPNQLHVEHALQCIDAGVPMLLEKPIAPTVEEGERLVEVRRRDANAKLLIGHHRAHSPIMAKAKQVVDSGVLGRLVAVMGSAMFFKPDHYFADAPWRREPGGGPILLNMIHEVHNLRMLVRRDRRGAGDSRRTRRAAFRSRTRSPSTCASPTARSARFMLSDTAACPRSWEQTSQENKAYPTYDDEDCYVIAGTLRQPVDPDDAVEDLSARRGPLVVEAVRGRRGRTGARRSAEASDRALRRRRPRRGAAAGQRARRAGEPARHRGHRRGREDRPSRRDPTARRAKERR